MVIAHGGSAVLGETPEIYGAEHLLTRRAVTPEVGQKLVERIKWWEWYTGIFGARIDNNPSPGNKAGGLTTIYEKSLGALAKAGSTPLVDVVPYAAAVTSPGLVFMDTPGYDPPCTTGLVASGANVLVFTTGRGSVLGLKPTPCIKLATNTPMYDKMRDDMDMNAGMILEGETIETVGSRLFELILEVASGTTTRSEQQESARRSSPLGPSGQPCDRAGNFQTTGSCRRSPGSPRLVQPFGLAVLAADSAGARWLTWFLIEPLPNFPRESGTFRRGFLLLKAFPEVVPGTTFRQSLLGQAMLELSHVENLPQRLPLVAATRAHRAGGTWPG